MLQPKASPAQSGEASPFSGILQILPLFAISRSLLLHLLVLSSPPPHLLSTGSP